jgi:hypothetical protein
VKQFRVEIWAKDEDGDKDWIVNSAHNDMTNATVNAEYQKSIGKRVRIFDRKGKKIVWGEGENDV